MKIIKDSGNREKFSTGAVRDIQINKGRFDLLPMQVIQNLYAKEEDDTFYPYLAIWALAVHFEMGMEKYGERNWEKGIPITTYYNSAWRHLIKENYEWKDEPHLVAVAWNLVCMLWTIDKIYDGILPKELWNLPGKIVQINYDLELIENDDSDNLLIVCKDHLLTYLLDNSNDTSQLVAATAAVMAKLEDEEGKIHEPERT